MIYHFVIQSIDQSYEKSDHTYLDKHQKTEIALHFITRTYRKSLNGRLNWLPIFIMEFQKLPTQSQIIKLKTLNFGYMLFFISFECTKFEPDYTKLIAESLYESPL